VIAIELNTAGLSVVLFESGGSYANGFTALIMLAVIGTIVVSMLPRKTQSL